MKANAWLKPEKSASTQLHGLRWSVQSGEWVIWLTLHHYGRTLQKSL